MITIDVNLPTLSEEAKKRLAAEMRRPCHVLMAGALIRAIMERRLTIAPPRVRTGRLKGSGRIVKSLSETLCQSVTSNHPLPSGWPGVRRSNDGGRE